jgi:hypothetical protein
LTAVFLLVDKRFIVGDCPDCPDLQPVVAISFFVTVAGGGEDDEEDDERMRAVCMVAGGGWWGQRDLERVCVVVAVVRLAVDGE